MELGCPHPEQPLKGERRVGTSARPTRERYALRYPPTQLAALEWWRLGRKSGVEQSFVTDGDPILELQQTTTLADAAAILPAVAMQEPRDRAQPPRQHLGDDAAQIKATAEAG